MSDADQICVRFSFDSVPSSLRFSFRILYREAILKVRVDRQKVSFHTDAKANIPILVFGKKYTVKQGGLEVSMPAKRLAK